MTLRIYPYIMGSASVNSLKREMDDRLDNAVLSVRPDGRFRGGPRYKVINWGNSQEPNWYANMPPANVLNHPCAVRTASNKRTFMQALDNDGSEHCLSFATGLPSAERLILTTDNPILVVRTTLQGHSGEGIHLARSTEELHDLLADGVRPKLYTLHVRHRDEYRVHMFRGEVLDVQMKRRRTDFEGEVNTHVRSHANGWVFCRENVVAPGKVVRAAQHAMAACALDFGAVDVAYRVTDDKAYALEVNTAPGLEGTTLVNYANAFLNWYGN